MTEAARQGLIKKIAFDLYGIRKKRVNDNGNSDTDWITAKRIVEHFETPDSNNWLWRFRDEDYEKYAAIYEKHRAD